MSDTRALTAQEIDELREWLNEGKQYFTEQGDGWGAYCVNALRALDELVALRRELARLRELLTESAWLDEHTCEDCEHVQEISGDSGRSCELWIDRAHAFDEARMAALAPGAKDDPDPHGIRAAVDMLLGDADGGGDAA